jgi:hypothetical protein
MSIKLQVIYGTEQVRKHENGDVLTEEEKDMYLKEYFFETMAEKTAFLKGMDEAADWLEYLPLEPEEYNETPIINHFIAEDVDYLRPDKTIETVMVSNEHRTQVYYVYNYQGLHFRVFPYITDLMEFFDKGTEPKYHFESDEELDAFFETMSLEQKYS